MQTAERVCKERNLRLTRQRRRVLELVWQSHRPVGAYELLDQLGSNGARPAPPTVYRALDFLIEAGLVHRLDSLNAFVGCSDPGNAHSGQFLICSRCRTVAEIDDRELVALVTGRARLAGFEPESLVVEIKGYCADCAPR